MDRLAPMVVSVVAAAVFLVVAVDSYSQAQIRQRDQVQERAQEKTRRHEIIPGSELMTSAEREDYRKRYAAARTDAEREKVRTEHIKAMQERARQRGLQLAEPAAAAKAAGK